MDLVNGIVNELQEMTTSSDVAFIPGGFSSARDYLKDLSGEFETIGVKIVESGSGYSLDFENGDSMYLPESDFSDLGIDKGSDYIELKEYLIESNKDDINSLFNDIENSLVSKFLAHPIDRIDTRLFEFKNMFRGRPASSDRVLIKYESIEADIDSVIKSIKTSYSDDRGSLEMLLKAIETASPLSNFEPFNTKDFLFGGRYTGDYQDQTIIYEGLVSMTWDASESILVKDEDIADAMDDYGSYKVKGTLIYPVSQLFDNKIFLNLKNEIDMS